MIAPGLFFDRVCLSADFSFVLTWDLGSLWFTGHTLFYLLFRGFYHYGIRKDRNNVVHKLFNSPYKKRKQGVGVQPPLFNKQNVKI